MADPEGTLEELVEAFEQGEPVEVAHDHQVIDVPTCAHCGIEVRPYEWPYAREWRSATREWRLSKALALLTQAVRQEHRPASTHSAAVQQAIVLATEALATPVVGGPAGGPEDGAGG